MAPSASQLKAESAIQHIPTDRADERRFLSCCFSLVGTGNQKGEVHRLAETGRRLSQSQTWTDRTNLGKSYMRQFQQGLF